LSAFRGTGLGIDRGSPSDVHNGGDTLRARAVTVIQHRSGSVGVVFAPNRHPQGRSVSSPSVRGARTFFVMLVVVAGTLTVPVVSPPAAAWINVTVHMSGLDWPIAIAFAPDGRIFFAERLTGQIRIIENGTLLPDPFYTLSNTRTEGERGLLGLALDPAFAASPYVYAYHTFDDGANGIVNRIVRILADGNTGVSLEEIFRTPPLSAATNHNGGVIDFGPDGKLYAVVGENAWPPLAQDPMSPMGKVLRMNTNGSAPEDNPFYGNSSWNQLIYAYGLRNMFGLAFHFVTSEVPTIFVTENGPECNDEVNLLTAGGNFGWGPSHTCLTPPPPPDNTNQDGPSPILPIWWWGRTICPTNAAIHDGPGFPAWRGDLFMGDCNTGTLRRLDLRPPDYTSVEGEESIYVAPSAILEVEAGPDGAIWFTTPSTIYRLWDSGKPPVAAFHASPNPVVVGQPVEFNGSASYDPDGTIVSHVWDFGDGNTNTGEIVSHTYASVGTYNVSLTVVDNESYADTAYLDIVVTDGPPPIPPIANFTANPNPVVVLIPVEFNASASYDPDGTIVSYEWNFGDGEQDNRSGPIVTHIYGEPGRYNVSLKVTDNGSNSDVAFLDVTVNDLPPAPLPPRANFTLSPSPVAPGVPVTFDGSSSSDSDGRIVFHRWSFGDGTNQTGVGRPGLTTHTYQATGTYTVALTVRDNDNLTKMATRLLVVSFPPTPVMEAVSTTYIREEVSFSGLGSSDPDGTIVNWTWAFGDQSMDWEPRVFHRYQAKGMFTVTLTVRDNDGMTNSTTAVIEVRNRPPAIESTDPGPGPVSLAPGMSRLFDVNASDLDGDVLSYTWRVNDTLAGTARTLNFLPPGVGSYIVNVTVSDGTASVYREWTVTVSSTTVPAGDGAWIGLVSVAVVLIGIGSAAAVVAWRRHRARGNTRNSK
jgi:glucose/arabinose dehydrogenase/chitodextrinase